MRSSRVGQQADHVNQEQRASRDEFGNMRPAQPHRRPPTRRPPALHVIPPDWQPLEGVPSSRDACRGKEKACPFIRCRYHLWLKLSEDRDGRKSPNGRKAPSVLYPTSSTSCSLAVAERGEQ